MKTGTLTFQLLTLIAGAFAILILSVLFFANLRLTQLIDTSQQNIYGEKLLAITGVLQRKADRLQKTGLVHEYEDDFKSSALKELRMTYQQASSSGVYPFIIGSGGDLLMHPYPFSEDSSLPWNSHLAEVCRQGSGSMVILDPAGEKHWLTFSRFNDWQWIVGFAVPFNVKYADARRFGRTLLIIMGGIGFSVLLVLFFFIIRFTRPITRLTEASREMAGGNLTADVDTGRNDEIGLLARSFVKMRDSVGTTIQELDEKNRSLTREIKDKEHAQKQLQRLRNYLENIINSMPSILVSVDPDGIITQWNLKAEATTGLTALQAIGRQIDAVYPDLASEMGMIRRAIQSRQVLNDKRTLMKNGDRLHQEVTVFPLIANGVDGVVIRVDDVTERVRMEEMMIQTEKMMSVGGLAAGMAHEINNPLGVMIQACQNILRRTSPDLPANIAAADQCGLSLDALKAYFDQRQIFLFIQDIRESGQRAATIVSNMLQFSRKSDSKRKRANLADVMETSVFLAENDYDLKKKYDFRSISINREFDPDLPLVSIIVTEIEQVILNLLKNAAHAMADNRKTLPVLTLKTRQSGNWAVMEVTDNGPGMSEAVQKRIFEPFFTTKPVGIGTGLGLSVSYMIIKNNHGGTMEARSAPGEGTTFIIRLPIET